MIRSAATIALAAALLATPAAAQKISLDVAIFHPEPMFFTHQYKWWENEVAKATEGRVTFTAHYSGSLVRVTETMRAVRDGAVPVGTTSAAAISGQVPAMAYIEVLGGMPDDPKSFAEASAQLRPVLEEMLGAQGVVFLWGQPAFGTLAACRDRHLRQPADWRGVKVRAAGRWQVQQMIALGASAVALDPAEQYLALQNRTIDCALSVSPLALGLKMYEPAPKITQLGVPVNLTLYLANPREWNRILEADRAKIREISIQAQNESAKFLHGVTTKAQDEMAKHGADIYHLTPDQTAAFKAAIRPVFDKIDAEVGPEGKPIADALRRFW